MSQILTSRQAEELHKSMIAYLTSINLPNSAAALREELQIGESFDAATSKKYEGLLEKKWTSVVRLQKKIMELESRNASLQSEIDSATPTSLSKRNQDPTSWLPRSPARHTLQSHREPVTCVAFHPVFSSLASGSEDYTIKIWDWELGELERTVKGHTRPVLDVDFGGPRGGTLLASCSSDLTIKLWDPSDEYKNIRTLPGHDHSVSAVRFIPSGAAGSPSSGNLLVSASRDKSLPSYGNLATLAGLKKPPSASSSAEFVATGGRDKSIRIWDARGTLIKTLVGHDNWVRGLVFHPGGKYLLSVSDDKTLRCWDLSQEGKMVKTLDDSHGHFVSCIRWAPGVIKDVPATNGENGATNGIKKDDTAKVGIRSRQIADHFTANMASMHAFTHGSSSESSEDDDPNAEEFADYNPRKRRRTGRDAKESAAMGIFGSESEDEGSGRRWKKKTLRGKGMAFVSTGQTNLNDEDDEDDEEEEAEDEDVDMEEEEAEAPRGLGFGARGLGFQSPAPAKSKDGPKIGTPLGRGFVPSSAAVPILQNDEEEVSTPRIARPSAFSTPASSKGMSGKNASGSAPINAGSFAARMMAKMGYKEGQGLGKEGTGRSGVIEVVQRPQGVGLGAVKEKSRQEIEEEKRQAKIRGEKYEDSDEERKKKRRKPKTSGTDSGGRSGMSTPRRAPKPKFRTLEEVQRAAPGLEIPDVFAPILDMSGPGQRLLTSTSGLLTPTTGKEKTESVEQIESKKLARRAQNELSAHVEEWKNLDERKAYVGMEILQEQQGIDELQAELDQFKIFVDAAQEILQASKDGQWDPIIGSLIKADELQVSDVNGELSDTAVAAVHPFLTRATEGWQPLDDPKLNGLVPQLHKIRHILGVTSNHDISKNKSLNGFHRKTKATTAYESMVYKVTFPKVVSAINQSWNVYHPASLLTLLESWEGLLPTFIRSLLFDQAIVAKLNEAVSSWNPRKRRSHELPHLWLFPWLQYLPAHHADPKSSTGLVSDIKRKFRHLVDSWDFHKGVVPGFKQWREVLCPTPGNDHWTPLIMNHVLPSMGRFLKNPKNFVVDPNDQAPYMSALQGVFAWEEILKAKVVGQVIVETVFPMWHSVLHQWLTEVGPNEEIGQWFEWWRDSVFPADIKKLPCLEAEFTKGHEMIIQALDLGSKVSTLPLPSTTHTPSRRTSPVPVPQPSKPPPQLEEQTFRQKLEDWCIENDLQFLPEKKVLHDKGPLYRITAAGNGKNGALAFFRGEGLVVLSKRGSETVEVGIKWESDEARDALLEMAWFNVK
ncbi:hypothetical protein HYFRA_00000621 [Hymenoscyphus fraxineus]|uniref:G-patch domain-containing protein n=1 Tax=Hymenoscyphus fraxineus TaxID=746836 RepID=A0A9N9PSP3_9HELO|nr:hypothetical protein HYFRA_00000621 [Hymenoscyphus fraxineus]